jgi:hypothetical protein
MKARSKTTQRRKAAGGAPARNGAAAGGKRGSVEGGPPTPAAASNDDLLERVTLAERQNRAAEQRARDLLGLPSADADELLTVDEALAKIDISCSGNCDVFDSDEACCAIRGLRVAGWSVARMRDASGRFAIVFTPPEGTR